MALALTAGPTLPHADPTTSLKNALGDFEGTLSEAQRLQYQAEAVTPDPTSVTAFVSKMDAENQSRAGRCVAPRLCTFLEAVRQFSGIVETFVSSHPTVAALVWGGVKIALLIASNIALYFDKVTNLIMVLGRSCPKYKEFGLLYPGNVSLQEALCDYFAVVIHLCGKIVEVSKRSGFSQIFSSILTPFEADFGKYQDELYKKKKEVQISISLASQQAAREEARLSEIERKANSVRHGVVSLFQAETRIEHAKAQEWRLRLQVRQSKKMKASIRANLSTLDHHKSWKRAMQQCLPGTAIWFQRDPSFCKWIEDDKTSILWCSGNLGSGKTVLTSKVVGYLHENRKPTDVVSYFFCQADSEESLLARNIFGSIACQLLDVEIERAKDDELDSLYTTTQNLDAEDIIAFLISRIKGDSTNYVVLDGLEECGNEELVRVSKAIDRLYKSQAIGLKIFCAGGSSIERQIFRNLRPTYRISTNSKEAEFDIEVYIKSTLEQKLDSEELKLGDPTLIFKIKDALQAGARGMFLWAYLLVKDICEQDSDQDILNALESLPNDLYDLFHRLTQRIIRRKHAKRATKVLQLSIVTKRPLTIGELEEALALEPGQRSLQRQAFSNDIFLILADCCGLTFVEEEDQTVHLIHPSVQQHLINGDPSFDSHMFDRSQLEIYLGSLCMTYLDFNEFKQQLAKVDSKDKVVLDPARIALTTLPRQGGLTAKIALRLLRGQRQVQVPTTHDLDRQLKEVLGNTEAARLEEELKSREFQFLSYARTCWIFHVRELESSDKKLWPLFCKCVASRDVLADRPWELGSGPKASNAMPEDEKASMILTWILSHNHIALLKYFRSSATNILSDQAIQRTILSNKQDQLTHVASLLKRDGMTMVAFGELLIVAANQGSLELTQKLLAVGINVNTATPDGETALHKAAEGGHLDVVKVLLAANADVNAVTRSSKTALHEAAKNGHLDIIKMLLAANADVNAATESGATALHEAAGGGYLDVVKMLLAANADINAAADYGDTALHGAAHIGHLDVVEMLLEAKADVNSRGHLGFTALMFAAMYEHLNIVKSLLTAGADVNCLSANEETALDLAEHERDKKVVRVLKDAGAKTGMELTDEERERGFREKSTTK